MKLRWSTSQLYRPPVSGSGMRSHGSLWIVVSEMNLSLLIKNVIFTLRPSGHCLSVRLACHSVTSNLSEVGYQNVQAHFIQILDNFSNLPERGTYIQILLVRWQHSGCRFWDTKGTTVFVGHTQTAVQCHIRIRLDNLKCITPIRGLLTYVYGQ